MRYQVYLEGVFERMVLFDLIQNSQQILYNRLMKSRLWLFSFISITIWLYEGESSNCPSPFQQVPYSSGSYCAKCDTTCLTCLGAAINQCSTCPPDFTLNSGTSSCVPPMSSSINTVINSYHSYNFIVESTWPNVYAYSTGTITVLRPSATYAYISSLHSLEDHYEVRIRVAYWSFGSAGTLTISYTSNTPSSNSTTSTTSSTSANYGGSTYDAYAQTVYATNAQAWFNDSLVNPATVNVTMTSSTANWGINQYIFIQYLCSKPDCDSCVGPASSDCTSCSDSNKKLYIIPGSCQCKFQNGYYAYPTGNGLYYCVNPCPNLPSGQYYGDNFTKTCVMTCPANSSNTGFWQLSFASDEYGFCVNQCPLTMIFGGQQFYIYYDLVGRKCTTKCPTAQPYRNDESGQDRACYATCPLSTSSVQLYKLNTTMSCVSKCPNITNSADGVQIPLYRDPTTLTCVQICPSGYWGFTNSSNGDRYCIINNCPTGSGQFTDNSTGRPICTIICPAPNYFGDYYVLPSACVQTCSFPYFGDQNHTSRYCVSKCNGSYFGLQSGSRQCVKTCPTQNWGERLKLVCVVAPFQCNLISINFTSTQILTYPFDPSINSFADNFTRMCIWANQSCSNFMYKLNSSMTCETYCPDGTYAQPITFWCVDKCYGIYFADPHLDRCVEVCSPGLYADVGSGNTCVTSCNQTGGYPYRDESIRKCVSVCTVGYADPLAQSCVFNCTPGLYLNGSDSSNQTYKQCTQSCSAPYFAYNNTDTGICIDTCPVVPAYFGDIVGGLRICVEVCSVGSFGDQLNNSYRHCVSQCPNTTFAQNDTLRRCVKRCNDSTYGRVADWICVDPQNCPPQYTGDPSTNLCVTLCPALNGTFSDNISKLCVQKCPIQNETVYYAQTHTRWCIPTCAVSELQFGNNETQTCQKDCLDNNSFADAISPRRYCIALCTNYVTGGVTTLYYRNNYTKTCVISTGCSTDYFGDNITAYCVKKCSKVPNNTGVQSWGYVPTKTCVELCLPATFGDDSSGVPLCVSLCPEYPVPKWSYEGINMTVMLCKSTCPSPYFGEDFLRTCVTNCPRQNSMGYTHNQTYAYDGTRRCLFQCPNTTFADYINGVCFHYSINCTTPCAYNTVCAANTNYRWGDPYNNSCTYLCTAVPWDTYGDNATQTCTTNCTTGSYAQNYTGTRTCIAVCPGYYNSQGVVDATKTDITSVPYDSYGDNYTNKCVKHCQMPDTYADWQAHLCLFRCTGDDNWTTPTYANVLSRRCVIALFCPQLPDKYYGQNITRMCQTACPLNGSYVSFADNITKTCIPVCYEFLNTSVTPNIKTMFYGDVSTLRPMCVIACAVTPRQFGQNSTHLCTDLCPLGQFGDQTGNRTCVPVCPNINNLAWFSQDDERICVIVCKNETWGNFYNSVGPHCEVTGHGCRYDHFGDNSTHMCVDLCPQSMNYFGDPSSRLCTDRCPDLADNVTNVTANLSVTAGRLFADYKTRICVHTCPLDFGLQGTFGDNSTNTCVERCPNNSYGDSNTVNRFCVAVCTGESFADDSTTLCVDICPASPPTFGFKGNWTCLMKCPDGYWADSLTRTCKQACDPAFRLNYPQNQCVTICPSDPDLYADTNGNNCTLACTNSKFADPTDRTCKTNCTPLFQYNYRCVLYCPEGLFADNNNNCVGPKNCQGGTYGDNSTTLCISPCPSWSYADDQTGFCIAICPSNTFGQNFVCVSNCSSGTSASNITQLCQSVCPNGTYAIGGFCVNNCTGNTFQNQVTRKCEAACPANLFADPNSNRCLRTCPTGWYRQSQGANTGRCVPEANGCSPLFADFYTGNCVTLCSSGYWGFKDVAGFFGNYTCLTQCPDGLYGFEDVGVERNCYPPTNQPHPTSKPTTFGDSITKTYVLVCPTIPIVYFGDQNRQICVAKCTSFNLTGIITKYYGDPQTRRCQSTCANTTYTADDANNLCTLRCTQGTFRYNITPICVNPCTVGFGDYTTRICVATCPLQAGTYGFYNSTSGSRLCMQLCPLGFYSEPVQRTCTNFCPNTPIKYYAFNGSRQCLAYCPSGSFADDDIRRCVSNCVDGNFPNADNSTNKCVLTCPDDPDYYSDNHVCVYFCTTPNFFADQYSQRSCVSRCTNTSFFQQYGDSRTGRCEKNCSEGTWGDNFTNTCVKTCPDGSFADNTTGICVAMCPKIQNIYADPLLHACSYTCSGGYFGSQISQTCIPTCEADLYYGDPTTTLCTSFCPAKIYSYGQNTSRTCVKSCIGYDGYADNYSRLCRQFCQHTLLVQTYIDYTNKACVQICPQGTWATNYTAPNNTINQCVNRCPSGFADNFSSWCVSVCPNDPQSYGDMALRVCLYTCLNGQFSDNSTNLCVPVCPSLASTPPADYFGDIMTGRCARWCSQGFYAQNSSRLCVGKCDNDQFADNLTRKCVTNCPPSDGTFADSTTNRCVRICPPGFWAENTTQACVPDCWTYTNGSLNGKVSYADNKTNFCVLKCPFDYFGTNRTHKCLLQCPQSQNEYGHPIGRVCIGTDNSTRVIDCYGDNVTKIAYYGDPKTRLCVQKCPLTLWADTNIFKCVDTCDSTKPEFRNHHTQMCVRKCPSDPDQFADPLSGNCVRTCPNNTYAYTTDRVCYSSCASFFLFADNTTNRCGVNCSTYPYLYADNLTYTCVLHCSQGQYADNRSQTCVSVCPAQWGYFGQLHTFTCVSLCQLGQFADESAWRTCRSTCSNSFYADSFTRTCVEHCRYVRPFWYEDNSKGYGQCVDVCPGQSYAFNSDQTCKTQIPVTFQSGCPGSYYADRASKQCVKFCPNGTFADENTKYCEKKCNNTYYADPVLRKCATSCSDNLYKFDESFQSLLCVQYCPTPLYSENYTGGNSKCVAVCTQLGYNDTRSCESYCPHPSFADWTNHLCKLNCTPQYNYMPNRTCLSKCEQPYYGNPQTHTCDLICPQGYFGRNDTRMCDTDCPSLSFADPSIRICVADCPTYPLLYADSRTNQCLQYCQSPLFGSQINQTCVPSCPNVTQGVKTLIFLADQSNRLCVLSCVNTKISFADYSKNECTQYCPNGTFASNYTKQCVEKCPNQPNNTFSDNSSHICMEVCLPGSYGMPQTLNCVKDCWWPYYADPTTNRCVDFCPDAYFGDNKTATCVKKCPAFSYADPETHRCLGQCPALQKYFNFNDDWTCVKNCPPSFYANTNTSSCTSICNSTTGMFSYELTNQCVMECPIPYRGFTPNYTCVLSCPELYYFYDVSINTCANCDPTCIICSSLSSCTQCQVGYNLFNGYCTRNCYPTGNSITYAHPLGGCVSECPFSYFGQKGNYTCTQNCGLKMYGNPTSHLCQACPATCASCASLSECYTCEQAATLAIDKMCYRDCNSTHKFSFNQSCFNTCPTGTYVSYTQVTCTACSPICYTCFGEGTRCTSCLTTYFYNNNCLTKCPTGFYGSTSLQCLTCNGTTQPACTNPLNFTTSFTTENFQPVITLQFNQNVSLEKNLEQILKINLKLKRLLVETVNQDSQDVSDRILITGTIINDGISYTYEILSNGTIKLYPQIGTSLVNPTFSVQITDPAAVISTTTGGSLQNVESELSLQSLEFYPSKDADQASTNFPAKLITVITLILFAISFVFSDTMIRPLQILQILFFHAAIQAKAPANVFYFLKQIKYSTLDFIANWFEEYLPLKSPYYDTPLKIADLFIDEIFLRNVGQIFVFITILSCFWFVFLILGNKRLMKHKIWQGFFEEVSVKRFRLMILNDIFSLFYMPICYFMFMQAPKLFDQNSGIFIANALVAIILLVGCIIIPIAWGILWKKKPIEQINNQLWFLTIRIKKLQVAEVLVYDSNHEKDYEQKSQIQKKLEKQPKEEKNAMQLDNLVFLGYQFLMALWLTSLYNIPEIQLTFLIITNGLYLAYYLKVRPHLNIINLIFTVLSVLSFILIESLFLYFYQNPKLTANQKTVAAFPVLVAADSFCVLMILWVLWRFVWQASFYWNNFKKTELYLQFADHEYAGEEEKTEQFSVYQKRAQKLQVGLGDIVIDEIIEKVSASGQKIILVKKKRLIKKPKMIGRKKVNGEAQYDQLTQNQEYMRVNPVNIFDYNEHFQHQSVAEKPVPQPAKKRVIDDDVRDMVSDASQNIQKYIDEDEQEKKIDVEPGEELLNNIEDLSQVNSKHYSSQKISDYPFMDIEDKGLEQQQEEKMSENEIPSAAEYYRGKQQVPEAKQEIKQSPRQTISIKQASYDELKSQDSLLKQQQNSLSIVNQHNQPKQEEEISKISEYESIEQLQLDQQGQSVIEMPKKQIKNIQDLLQEQETANRKRNLMFLFDDFEEDAE